MKHMNLRKAGINHPWFDGLFPFMATGTPWDGLLLLYSRDIISIMRKC